MSVATVTNIRYDNPRPHLQTLPLIAAARKGEPPRLTRSARQNQVQHLLRHPSLLPRSSSFFFSLPYKLEVVGDVPTRTKAVNFWDSAEAPG